MGDHVTIPASVETQGALPFSRARLAGTLAFWWKCRTCEKSLGYYDARRRRLVIRHGPLALAASLPLDRVCERCGSLNGLVAE